MDCSLFPDINHLMMLVGLILILEILLKIKSLLLFLANGRAC